MVTLPFSCIRQDKIVPPHNHAISRVKSSNHVKTKETNIQLIIDYFKATDWSRSIEYSINYTRYFLFFSLFIHSLIYVYIYFFFYIILEKHRLYICIVIIYYINVRRKIICGCTRNIPWNFENVSSFLEYIQIKDFVSRGMRYLAYAVNLWKCMIF